MSAWRKVAWASALGTVVVICGSPTAANPAAPVDPPAAIDADCSVPAGQVGWWRAEGQAADAQSGLMGSFDGVVSFVPGVHGQAFRFTGGGELAGVPRSAVRLSPRPDLQGQSLTVTAWVKRAEKHIASRSFSGAGAILAGGPNSFSLTIAPDGTLFLSHVGVDNYYGTGAVTDLGWHHVAMALGDGTVRFYLDGEPAGERSAPITLAASPAYAIGALGQAVGAESYGFLGDIDDVRFFSRVLSLAEVRRARDLAAGSCQENVRLTATAEEVRLPLEGVGQIGLRLTNESGDPSPAASVSVPVPVGLTVTWEAPVSGTVRRETGKLVWEAGVLPRRSEATLRLTLGAAADFRATLRADLTVAGPDVDEADNRVDWRVLGAAACQPLPGGALAWWPGEGGGEDFLAPADSPGQILNGVTFVAGQVGEALSFSGQGGIDVPRQPGLDPQQFTVEAWVRRRSGGGNGTDPSGEGVILAGGTLNFVVGLQAENRPFFRVVGGPATVTADTALGDFAWHHVAVTVLPGVIRFYVDGVPAGTAWYATPGVAPGALGVGKLAFSVDGREYPFRGDLDEVTLYSRALDAAEVAVIHAAGTAGKCREDLTLSGPVDVPVPVDETALVQWTVRNRGGVAQAGVRFSSRIPEGWTLVGTTTSQGVVEASPGRVEVGVGTVAPGGEVRVVTELKADGPRPLTAWTAEVQGQESDVRPENNTVTIGLRAVPLEISAMAIEVPEGNAGVRNFSMPVLLSVASRGELRVDYRLEDGSSEGIAASPARAGEDYVAGSGTLVFPAGSLGADIPVGVLGDVLRERTETLWIRLSAATRGVLVVPSAPVRILDDEVKPSLTLEDVALAEGGAGVKLVDVPLRLSAPLGFPLSVTWTTTNGTARSGTDYLAASGRVEVPAGQVEIRLPLTVYGDTQPEPNESLGVRVALDGLSVGEVVLADALALVTVLNDDAGQVPVAGFRWEGWPLDGPLVGAPFPAELVAVDAAGAVITGFNGAVSVAAYAGGGRPASVLVTEFRVAGLSADGVELQNVGTNPVVMQGWKATFYDETSWPAPQATFVFPDGFTVLGRESVTLTESTTTGATLGGFRIGALLNWRDSNVGGLRPLAVLLQDAEGRVVDYVGVNGAEAALVNLPVSLTQGEWTGPSLDLALLETQALQRKGDYHERSAAGWEIRGATFGQLNAGLKVPFRDARPIPGTSQTLQGFVNGRWQGTLRVDDYQSPAGWFASDGNGRFGASPLLTLRLENDLAVTTLERLSGYPGPGSEVRYRVAVTNPGPAIARDLRLEVETDPRVTLETNRFQATVSLGTVTVGPVGVPARPGLVAQFGDLPAGGSASLEFTVGPFPLEPRALGAGADGDFVLTARLGERAGEPNAANNALTLRSPWQTGAVPLASGGTYWWRAEGNGREESGGPVAVLQQGATFGEGRPGQGFELDGVDDRINVPDADGLDFGPEEDFTLELWFRTSSTKAVTSLLDKRDAPEFVNGVQYGGAVGYALFLNNGRLGLQLGGEPLGSSLFQVLGSFTGRDLRDGRWHHAAARIVRRGQAQLWVDGVPIASTSAVPYLEQSLVNAEPLRIGSHATPGYDAFFRGQIDEVLIHRRALTDLELLASAQAGAYGHESLRLSVLPPVAVGAGAGVVDLNRLVIGRPQRVAVVVSNAGPANLTGTRLTLLGTGVGLASVVGPGGPVEGASDRISVTLGVLPAGAVARVELDLIGRVPGPAELAVVAPADAVFAGLDQRLVLGVTDDTDGDGLPDAVERGLGLDPEDPTDAAGDLDRDGASNLAEYLAGTDPKSAADRLELRLEPAAGGGWQIRFQARAGRGYRLEWVGSLAGGTVWTTMQVFGAEAQGREVTWVLGVVEGAGYFRLVLQP